MSESPSKASSSTSEPSLWDTLNDPDTLNRYNRHILAFASVAAFGTLSYTVFKKTKVPTVSVHEILNSPHPFKDPRVTAYMYAGRAFGTATMLCLTGAGALTFGVAHFMGINSFKDLSTRLQSFTQTHFPSLQRTHNQIDNGTDAASQEFMKEWNSEMERDARGEIKESAVAKVIGAKFRSVYAMQDDSQIQQQQAFAGNKYGNSSSSR